jgi:hypothetical protein
MRPQDDFARSDVPSDPRIPQQALRERSTEPSQNGDKDQIS